MEAATCGLSIAPIRRYLLPTIWLKKNMIM
jgi:hypothetical protein